MTYGSSGGEEGIRTLDAGLPHTPLAGERLRPLGHLSTAVDSEAGARFQAELGGAVIFVTLLSLFPARLMAIPPNPLSKAAAHRIFGA